MSTEIALNPTEARELTDRIKVGVEAIWELVKQAYQSRAWSALGYESWDDYCTREFGTSRIRLPREERQEVVASMREIGMSTRAIASATGVSKDTVRREISTGANAPVDVTGVNGKTYTPKPRPEPEPAPDAEPNERIDDSAITGRHDLASALPQRDLDELNTPAPKQEPEIRKPLLDDVPDDPREHLVDLMDDLRKAEKALREAIFTAQRINGWSQGPVSTPLRELLDQLDNTLESGGMDAELARLIEGID